MTSQTLARRAAIAYALPSAGFMWLQLVYNHYVFKYAVDVLLIPSAVMGAILFGTRIWDAVSDPLVGYLTDGTRAASGRRRPWLLGSLGPVALATFLLWNPPGVLEGTLLVAWMLGAILLWETAMTSFSLPYYALGAEITMDHHDRTRVAGYRHVFGGFGQLAAIASVGMLTSAVAPRQTAFWLQLLGLPLVCGLMLVAILQLREPLEHRTRGARRSFGAFVDIVRNVHLMWLSAILFFEICGSAAIGVFAAFVCEYVIGSAGLFAVLLLAMQLASYAATPPVVKLSRRWGKKRAWAAAIVLQASGYLGMLGVGPGDAAWAIACFVLLGVGAAGASVAGLSIMADTVDYDEHRSGERKEAMHYSAINLTRKLAFGSMAMIGGLALGWIGFEPNAEQSADTLAALRRLFALLPGGAMLIALALLARFRLDEHEHARIRADLDARNADG